MACRSRSAGRGAGASRRRRGGEARRRPPATAAVRTRCVRTSRSGYTGPRPQWPVGGRHRSIVSRPSTSAYVPSNESQPPPAPVPPLTTPSARSIADATSIFGRFGNGRQRVRPLDPRRVKVEPPPSLVRRAERPPETPVGGPIEHEEGVADRVEQGQPRALQDEVIGADEPLADLARGRAGSIVLARVGFGGQVHGQDVAAPLPRAPHGAPGDHAARHLEPAVGRELDPAQEAIEELRPCAGVPVVDRRRREVQPPGPFDQGRLAGARVGRLRTRGWEHDEAVVAVAPRGDRKRHGRQHRDREQRPRECRDRAHAEPAALAGSATRPAPAEIVAATWSGPGPKAAAISARPWR